MLPLLIISTKITLLLPVPVTTKIIIYIFIYYCLPELKQVFFFCQGTVTHRPIYEKQCPFWAPFRHKYIYIWSPPPPPWSTYKHFIWELTVFYAHFFLPEKWHSHVSISFTYYVSRRPRHTHICNLFLFLFVVLLGKIHKNLEKTKKTKKNKIADPNSPACTDIGLAILFFLFFLDFSR